MACHKWTVAFQTTEKQYWSCGGYIFTPVCHSVHGRGSASVHVGIPPPDQAPPPGADPLRPGTPPRADTPQDQAPPGSRHPPRPGTPPEQTPWDQAPWSRHPPLGPGTPLGADTPPPDQAPPRSRHPPASRRLLLRTVRILLECILV